MLLVNQFENADIKSVGYCREEFTHFRLASYAGLFHSSTAVTVHRCHGIMLTPILIPLSLAAASSAAASFSSFSSFWLLIFVLNLILVAPHILLVSRESNRVSGEITNRSD